MSSAWTMTFSLAVEASIYSTVCCSIRQIDTQEQENDMQQQEFDAECF
jgi:hypothetical protein